MSGNMSLPDGNAPFQEAAGWPPVPHWRGAWRAGRRAESAKSGLPWRCWQEPGVWTPHSGWPPGPILWLLRWQRRHRPPGKPPGISLPAPGRSTGFPEPCFSSSSSWPECEGLQSNVQGAASGCHLALKWRPRLKCEGRRPYTWASAGTGRCMARSRNTPTWLGGCW